MFYVYMFKNKINGKVYVGKTGNLTERLEEHSRADGDCPAFHGAIKKYGFDNFELSILVENITENEANTQETQYIAHFKSNIRKYGDAYGYNLTDGGEGVSGHKHSIESRRKMSEKLKGRIAPNKGKKFSEEARQNMSASHIGQPGYWTGKTLSDGHREKMSESHIGQQSGMKGRAHSLESRQQMSESRIGKMKGEKSPNAKLTAAMANEIRGLYLGGNYSQTELAKKFGLGQSTISRVIINKDYFGGN